MKRITTLCFLLLTFITSHSQIYNFEFFQELSELNSVGIINTLQYSGWEIERPTQIVQEDKVITVEKFIFKLEGREQILKRITEVFPDKGYQVIKTLLIFDDNLLKQRFINTIPSFGYEKMLDGKKEIKFENGYNEVRLIWDYPFENEFYARFNRGGAFQLGISGQYYW